MDRIFYDVKNSFLRNTLVAVFYLPLMISFAWWITFNVGWGRFMTGVNQGGLTRITEVYFCAWLHQHRIARLWKTKLVQQNLHHYEINGTPIRVVYLNPVLLKIGAFPYMVICFCNDHMRDKTAIWLDPERYQLLSETAQRFIVGHEVRHIAQAQETWDRQRTGRIFSFEDEIECDLAGIALAGLAGGNFELVMREAITPAIRFEGNRQATTQIEVLEKRIMILKEHLQHVPEPTTASPGS